MTKNNTILDIPGMDIQQLQEQIVAEIRAGKSLLGKDGLLTPLIKSALEATLEGEMDSHIDESRANKRSGRYLGQKGPNLKFPTRPMQLMTSSCKQVGVVGRTDKIGRFHPTILIMATH